MNKHIGSSFDEFMEKEGLIMPFESIQEWEKDFSELQQRRRKKMRNNMVVRATPRKDLVEDDDLPTLRTLSGRDIEFSSLDPKDRIFESLQPDIWEDLQTEYNLLLVSEMTGEIYLGRSIDYDDYKEPEVVEEPKRKHKYLVRVVEKCTYEYVDEFYDDDIFTFETSRCDPIEDEVLEVTHTKID